MPHTDSTLTPSQQNRELRDLLNVAVCLLDEACRGRMSYGMMEAHTGELKTQIFALQDQIEWDGETHEDTRLDYFSTF